MGISKRFASEEYVNENINNISESTTSSKGFMSASDKTKLNGIESGAQKNTITGVKGGSESSYRTGNVNITKANIGLGNVDNTSDANKPVSTAQQNAIDASLTSANAYTDEKIGLLMNNSSEAVDSIMELADIMSENEDVVSALEEAVGKKVDKVNGKGLSTNDLTATLKSNYDSAYSHVSNKSNPHGVTLAQLGVNATTTELNYVDGVTSNIQTQLNGKASSDHTHSSYVNQNAFSNIAVSGQTTVAADTATDTVTFAGSNVTITTNATSDKVTFGVADASTSAKGVVQLVDSATNTATDKAATANAVNTAYTLASKANTTANSAKTTAESKSTVEASSTNGKIKIDGTDTTVYTHPTTAGNKHIPTGGSSGQVLKYSASGTATWGTDKDTTYSLSSGDNNGTIKITPSSGSAYNVAVKGLGSAAYTASTAYASSGHTHALLNNANGGQIGLLYETNDNTLNYFKPYNPVEGHTYNLGSVNNPWDGLYLKNDCNIYGIDTSGDKRINFTPCNYTNNCVVGYDNYVKADGNTNIYGNDVLIFSAAAGNSSARPYWRKGDSINYILHTAGYVTNGGKQVYFTVPLNRIVLGSGLTATAASSDGFILRQGAKYTHGSASSTYVKPTTYNAKIYTNYIYVTVTFSSTTNVINNAPCGILWSGTITIS